LPSTAPSSTSTRRCPRSSASARSGPPPRQVRPSPRLPVRPRAYSSTSRHRPPPVSARQHVAGPRLSIPVRRKSSAYSLFRDVYLRSVLDQSLHAWLGQVIHVSTAICIQSTD
jgi:hypothetical protein